MIRYRGLEFDIRDVLAGLLTIAVILYLFIARHFAMNVLMEGLDHQNRIRAEGFARIERKLDGLDRLEARLDDLKGRVPGR